MSDIPKEIPPTASIIKYLDEALDLEKYRRSGKKTFDGSRVGPNTEKEIKLKLRNNDDAKGRAIDNLFESMANLIYFFEFINKHPEILYRFKEDIEDMMGVITKSQLHLDSKDAPIARLIRELIGLEYTDTNFSYRTRLLHLLQFSINRKSDEIMMKLGEVPTKNDYQMRGMMSTDMKRSEVWMGYIDKYTVDKARKTKRLLNMNA